MNHRHLLLAAGLATIVACARTVPPPPTETVTAAETKNGVIVAEKLTVTAVVDRIDQQTRMITLRGSGGEKKTFRVGDDVRNLPQVKKGDEVVVTYYESIAVRLKKQGTPGASVDEAVAAAAPGQLPAGAAVRTVKVSAEVVGIDRARRTVTLKGARGKTRTIKVQNAKDLEGVNVGETVQAALTEAVAIAVEKPSGK